MEDALVLAIGDQQIALQSPTKLVSVVTRFLHYDLIPICWHGAEALTH